MGDAMNDDFSRMNPDDIPDVACTRCGTVAPSHQSPNDILGVEPWCLSCVNSWLDRETASVILEQGGGDDHPELRRILRNEMERITVRVKRIASDRDRYKRQLDKLIRVCKIAKGIWVLLDKTVVDIEEENS